ncbi:ammonium transporter [Eubacterium oxidoreducens]|uniref:Ammonium transporter, Amt family n=1 Tax=Eubacterium oxidoreducens TaxID=1732 RepID=A0A1G6AEH9_EUBOX|nr:ammonium transporter [Eubacterium oxidoreducens]SDB06821.1 ammonium transporter, Amt family [Eubacterium oxidoreducens]
MTQEIMDFVSGSVSETTFGVWFLIGAALVFWMQAGFAMVESGFTRAKNAGNIIMKNLMDFCIGTVMFIVIGSAFLLGEDYFGFIGKPGFDMFSNYGSFDYSAFVFNLVFCATTATIVSGAVAERTKFSSYCIYSACLSGILYPIEAHWTWGGGWLANMGFHDFAGSNCIHMVGGLCALIGAAMLGPRIGKFKKDSDGKVIKVNAIPGHNLPIGALGVFILWLGWYGFNGAAATSLEQLGSIFLTTTIAPAVATVTCMIFTWAKYGKPDVSMCLNASLAGLVAITAPCDVTDVTGSLIIGIVAGLLVVYGVWLLDYKLHIDDPVGAVAVHFINGIWGTIAVGLFATPAAPGYSIVDSSGNTMIGLFYGGGFKLLGIQFVGLFATMAWALVVILIVFGIIKKTAGLRVSAEEEIMGLDATEHDLASAYADFALTSSINNFSSHEELPIAEDAVSMDEAVPVQLRTSNAVSTGSDVPLTKITIFAKQSKYDALAQAMNKIGINGMTVTNVLGCGTQRGRTSSYRGVPLEMNLLPKIQVDIVVSKISPQTVIDTAKKVLYTGRPGDGKIFVYNVDNAIRISSGAEGYAALQD